MSRQGNDSASGAQHWSDAGRVDKLRLTGATHLSSYQAEPLSVNQPT